MHNPLLIPDVRLMLEGGETAALREFFSEFHPARIAEIIEDLESAERDAVFGLLDARTRAEVISYIDSETQVRLAEAMPPNEAAALLQLMPHDDRADLVRRMDEDLAEEVLRRLAQAEREDIRRLCAYESGTAGAVMTTDYATLSPDITVLEANGRIRQEAPDRETINYLYVVDHDRKLLGVVSLRNIFVARPRALISEIMKRSVIVAHVDDDQESVARMIEEYDLIAVPVVDADERLVGIVTHDDAADILRQEQTEDILRFGGVSPDPEADLDPYWQNTTLNSVRRRVKWLVMLFLAENFTYPVLQHFQWITHENRFPVLELFIPLLIGTGGNAGSQTVSTVIRGLALGQIRNHHIFRVIGREALTGISLGLILGLVGFAYSLLYRQQHLGVALVVGITILGICLWANVIGAVVPMLAHRFKLDPAVISAPFITTLVDATGLIIYFSIAILLLIQLKL